MFEIQIIEQELQKLNCTYNNICVLQNKDGVVVARVQNDKEAFIIKHFSKEEFKREIANYKLLKQLNIPTVTIFDYTDSAILMEDISQSDMLRLAVKEDLHDTAIASKIAEWYKLLHTGSKEYVKLFGTELYDETDIITRANIEFVKGKTHTQNLYVWNLIEDNFDIIISKINALPRVLTYNDFYYTNLIVAKDKASAFMFDYNLLGKGYVYSDIRNVCSSLGENAKKAFLESYGSFDESETTVDDVASVLVTLYYACKRSTFPSWAKYALEELKADYEKKVLTLIDS